MIDEKKKICELLLSYVDNDDVSDNTVDLQNSAFYQKEKNGILFFYGSPSNAIFR